MDNHQQRRLKNQNYISLVRTKIHNYIESPATKHWQAIQNVITSPFIDEYNRLLHYTQQLNIKKTINEQKVIEPADDSPDKKGEIIRQITKIAKDRPFYCIKLTSRAFDIIQGKEETDIRVMKGNKSKGSTQKALSTFARNKRLTFNRKSHDQHGSLSNTDDQHSSDATSPSNNMQKPMIPLSNINEFHVGTPDS